jgi:hypothetical protein
MKRGEVWWCERPDDVHPDHGGARDGASSNATGEGVVTHLEFTLSSMLDCLTLQTLMGKTETLLRLVILRELVTQFFSLASPFSHNFDVEAEELRSWREVCI